MKLCIVAELDLRHLQRLEQGEVNASLRTIARLAKVLEVTADELLAEKGSRVVKRKASKKGG